MGSILNQSDSKVIVKYQVTVWVAYCIRVMDKYEVIMWITRCITVGNMLYR